MTQGAEQVGVKGLLGFRACWKASAPGPVVHRGNTQVCHHRGLVKVLAKNSEVSVSGCEDDMS